MSHASAADPRIGSEFADYRVKRLLGRGGLSVVYLAEGGRLDRDVALKLLAPELGADARFRERFLRESKLAASLDHPNVIPLYAAGEVEDVLFIAMRYVEGADLAERLAGGHLSAGHTLSIVEPVADALDAAHAQGLIHGGVKPTNILTSDAGHVYVSDFGVAGSLDQLRTVPESDEFVGALDYLAPEQIDNSDVLGTDRRLRARVRPLSSALQVSQRSAGARLFRGGSRTATASGRQQLETPSSHGGSTPCSPEGWRRAHRSGTDPPAS